MGSCLPLLLAVETALIFPPFTFLSLTFARYYKPVGLYVTLKKEFGTLRRETYKRRCPSESLLSPGKAVRTVEGTVET